MRALLIILLCLSFYTQSYAVNSASPYTGSKESLNILIQTQKKLDMKCEVLKNGSGSNTDAQIIVSFSNQSEPKTIVLVETQTDSFYIVDAEIFEDKETGELKFLLTPVKKEIYKSVLCY